MSLLEDLRTVAATSLHGSELPTHVEVQDLLGAVVKTLDAAGITVAKDLLPAPAADVAAAALTAVEPVAQGELDKLLAYVKELEAKIEGKPAEPVVTPPVAASTEPVAPPIQGAN